MNPQIGEQGLLSVSLLRNSNNDFTTFLAEPLPSYLSPIALLYNNFMASYKDKTIHKLLYTRPFIGQALYKSLARPMRGFVLQFNQRPKLARAWSKTHKQQRTLSQSSRLCVPLGNLRCLAKSFLFGQIRSQTLMFKKLLQGVFVFVLLLLAVPSLSFAALPDGCKADYKFSPLTGQRCVDPKVADCAPGDLFSIFTGRSCRVPTSTPTSQPISQPVFIPAPAPVSNISNSTQALLQEYSNKLDVFVQQILDIKTQYYIDLKNIDQTAGFLAQANALKAKLLNDDNAKIDQINNQELQLYQDYKNKISNLSAPNSNVNTRPINDGSANTYQGTCGGYAVCFPNASA